jgi:hypothetical protein
MSKFKPRHEISEDELMYRQFLQDQWRIKPSRKAVQILETRICEVLNKLGINTDSDPESIQLQMEIMNVHINLLGEDDVPKAAGLYFSAVVKGVLQPYAYIPTAKVEKGKFWFPIVYWGEEGGKGEQLDEGVKEVYRKE